MSLMSGAVYLYAELVATVRESRRPFRDSGLCGERMRRPVLPAVGEKASGRGAVSCRLTGAWAFVGRGVRLACRVRFVRKPDSDQRDLQIIQSCQPFIASSLPEILIREFFKFLTKRKKQLDAGELYGKMNPVVK